jgi:hypothetical protein
MYVDRISGIRPRNAAPSGLVTPPDFSANPLASSTAKLFFGPESRPI